MGKPCRRLRGAVDRRQDGTVTIGSHTLHEGDTITIDGGTRDRGQRPARPARDRRELRDDPRLGGRAPALKVRANADTPEDAAKAREFGRRGSASAARSTCSWPRTAARRARDDPRAYRRRPPSGARPAAPAAGRLRGHLRGDAGLPATIRLLDPPLHEFLPAPEEATTSEMRARIAQLREANPMLGTRGCRLGGLTRRSTRCRCARSCGPPAQWRNGPGRRRSSRSCTRSSGSARSCADCAS